MCCGRWPGRLRVEVVGCLKPGAGQVCGEAVKLEGNKDTSGPQGIKRLRGSESLQRMPQRIQARLPRRT